MSRHGTIRLVWGGDERPFRLSFKELRELQELCDIPTGPATRIPTSGGSSGADAWKRETDAIEDKIRALATEAATLGMLAGPAAAHQTRVELTAAALEKGQAFYDATAAAIETYAQRIGTATSKLDEMRRALEASQEAQKALAAEASSAVEGMIFDAKSLNEALSDVAKNLARMLITGGIAGTGPLAGIIGTASTTGGAGGLFGSLFAGAFAGGGTIPAGKLGIMGENGPEVISAGRQPLTVTPPHKLPAGAGGGVTIVNQTNISAPGADAEKLARVETAVREMQRKDGARAVEAVMKYRRGRNRGI